MKVGVTVGVLVGVCVGRGVLVSVAVGDGVWLAVIVEGTAVPVAVGLDVAVRTTAIGSAVGGRSVWQAIRPTVSRVRHQKKERMIFLPTNFNPL
ncbi:MAG: hypothetical protein OT477_18245 [Chloroflexi bacterium]|nr:hypothetical protein [Chloroflexota bacterium]